MRKERMFRILVLAIVTVSILSLPQAYARGGGHYGARITSMYVISSVSNPSASCGSFGLTGEYGNVMVWNGNVIVDLQSAHPSSTYTVSVDKFTQGSCDGSWQSVGSINTDQAGNGLLTQKLNLQSGHGYVFRLVDAQGNLAYATA